MPLKKARRREREFSLRISLKYDALRFHASVQNEKLLCWSDIIYGYSSLSRDIRFRALLYIASWPLLLGDMAQQAYRYLALFSYDI